ncbi:MAG: trypsin-like peptidase domain-containing protein [Candidatus Eremiobacterota bacterium]
MRTLACLFLCLALTGLSQAQSEDRSLDLFDDLQKLIIRVSDRIKPAVVHIEVLAKRGEQRRKGLGSGLIVTADGTIVTNYHVIERAQVITVILSDKSKHEARVLRRDQQTDLALLKIDAGGSLPVARLGDSDKVRVGEWVLAIGNPYGFDRTVSFGIVSGKGRFIPDLDNEVPLLNDFIQTDALIDPGSSGGPLINLRGEVIGINSVGIGRGQGFTIPARVVKEVMTRSEVEGRIERGWLGVFMQPFTREMADYMRLSTRGVLVADVQPDSPAARAGLRTGDVLVRFNGEPVEAEQEEEINRFIQSVTGLAPGTVVPMEVYRDGQSVKLSVQIGTQPPVESEEIDTEFGVSVQGITWQRALEYRLENRSGVLVSYLTRGGPGDDAGLEVGDVIVAVDSTPVASAEEFKKMLPELNRRARFMLKVRRGRVYRYALIDQTLYRAPEDGQNPSP